jgi:hypothetical protein
MVESTVSSMEQRTRVFFLQIDVQEYHIWWWPKGRRPSPHAGGPEAGDHLYGPPESPHRFPVSPSAVASSGRPPKKPAAPPN